MRSLFKTELGNLFSYSFAHLFHLLLRPTWPARHRRDTAPQSGPPQGTAPGAREDASGLPQGRRHRGGHSPLQDARPEGALDAAHGGTGQIQTLRAASRLSRPSQGALLGGHLTDDDDDEDEDDFRFRLSPYLACRLTLFRRIQLGEGRGGA